MDFNSVTLFGKKTFADLLKEIHTNSSNKEKEIRLLIDNLKPLISSASDADSNRKERILIRILF
jgi:hypothetical protein